MSRCAFARSATELTSAVVTSQASGRSHRVSRIASAKFFRLKKRPGQIQTGPSSPKIPLNQRFAAATRCRLSSGGRTIGFGSQTF